MSEGGHCAIDLDGQLGDDREHARLAGFMLSAAGCAFISIVLCALLALPAAAADYPAAKEGSWIARDFRFHTGEVMPELRLHYRTIGEPTGEPVLVLHGTAGSGATLPNPNFAGELFGAGQPLDAAKHFIIIPDTVGHGKSSKPPDGLRTKFPRYDDEDMVDAHCRLVTEHLGVKRVRVVIGHSVGGMETSIFATKYPDFMDIAVPMACLPTEMSSRNWMMRRLITDSIRNDPDWKNAEYTTQPKSARFASVFFAIATNGGSRAHYKARPDAGKGRPPARQAPRRAIRGRCERRALPMGLLARRQPLARPGGDQGDGARHQLGRHRAQPA